MLTLKQIESVQKHLQSVFEQSVHAELKYMMEEDIIPGLFDEIDMDDILVELKVDVCTATNLKDKVALIDNINQAPIAIH